MTLFGKVSSPFLLGVFNIVQRFFYEVIVEINKKKKEEAVKSFICNIETSLQNSTHFLIIK